jgi:rRNA maturation RNase YbeY
LSLTNRQRFCRVGLRELRRIVIALLREIFGPTEFDLSICLISARQMTRLNESFLRHAGPTDVLAFDYSDPGDKTLRGEIFVCVEVAVSQSRHFRTRWQSELIRYLIHGLLHLQGYDDHKSSDRQRMKREENRLLKYVAGHLG